MGIWDKLFGGQRTGGSAPQPQRLDYLNEALALERQGDYEAALTSYRLAHRDNPTDARILLNMAIAYTKTAQPEEAIRLYRRALEIDNSLSGAHYGLAFLLLKRGEQDAAVLHLREFLARRPIRLKAEYRDRPGEWRHQVVHAAARADIDEAQRLGGQAAAHVGAGEQRIVGEGVDRVAPRDPGRQVGVCGHGRFP